MCRAGNAVECQIIPPHILRRIAERGDDLQKDQAFRALDLSARFRGQRQVLNNVAMLAMLPAGAMRRHVYTAGHSQTLPGQSMRGEGDPATGDAAGDEAYDSAGKTYDFFQTVFKRSSLDDRGMQIDSTVHYGDGYDNAFWNGQQMIYGDGDGRIFTRFTVAVDVIGHELTHGITQYEAELNYQGESGALNEHFSDVFGSLVKQYVNQQSAAQADWLIGEGLLLPGIAGVAIRSMKAPGTAYDDPLLGADPQPDHMSKFVTTDDDHGGVHINSGIPNKAFFTFAVSAGGNAWEQPGRIWYTTLCNELTSNATFQDCADKTFKVANDLYGPALAEKLRLAWLGVGITVATTLAADQQPATQTKAGTAGKPAAGAPAAAPGATALLAGTKPHGAASQRRRAKRRAKPR